MKSEDRPKCPYCGAPNNSTAEIDVWETIKCVKCGKSFDAKAIRTFATVTR